MGCKKQGTKNRAIVIQKEKRQPNLFSFWIKMTLFFTPCFLHPIFFRVANRPMFSKQESWGQIDSANGGIG